MGTRQRTFHEFSLLLGALLLSEGLEEAVVSQAGRVRQTLDDRVQETLSTQGTHGDRERFVFWSR